MFCSEPTRRKEQKQGLLLLLLLLLQNSWCCCFCLAAACSSRLQLLHRHDCLLACLAKQQQNSFHNRTSENEDWNKQLRSALSYMGMGWDILSGMTSPPILRFIDSLSTVFVNDSKLSTSHIVWIKVHLSRSFRPTQFYTEQASHGNVSLYWERTRLPVSLEVSLLIEV